ncbi:MAG: TIGR04282 family arsenosugar biosynthesis glycosyltransferase [Terrimicrobiaceae bacterium]|nr:TIGR04282 family arsenosugar biosynthesis glycosyltransferase [Terrimicrobiaceae bacterium]
MLKAPREGFVKTRLAKDVGQVEAVKIYRRLVEHQLQQIPSDWTTHVAYAPDDAAAEMPAWLGPEIQYFPQSPGTLGDRLIAALAQLPKPVIFLGGDCPALDTDRLLAAATALESADVVIWPAVDGGYCLIGLAKDLPEVFEKITWGTESVLEETLVQIPTGARVHLCQPPLEDIDDLPSWERRPAALR